MISKSPLLTAVLVTLAVEAIGADDRLAKADVGQWKEKRPMVADSSTIQVGSHRSRVLAHFHAQSQRRQGSSVEVTGRNPGRRLESGSSTPLAVNPSLVDEPESRSIEGSDSIRAPGNGWIQIPGNNPLQCEQREKVRLMVNGVEYMGEWNMSLCGQELNVWILQ